MDGSVKFWNVDPWASDKPDKPNWVSDPPKGHFEAIDHLCAHVTDSNCLISATSTHTPGVSSTLRQYDTRTGAPLIQSKHACYTDQCSSRAT